MCRHGRLRETSLANADFGWEDASAAVCSINANGPEVVRGGAPGRGGSTGRGGSSASAGALGNGGGASGSDARAGDGGVAGGATVVCRSIDYVDDGSAPREMLGCPVDRYLSECAGSDEGAEVARTSSCLRASATAHACSSRQLDASTMLVVLPFEGGCGLSLRLDSVEGCASEIRIRYSLLVPCGECDMPRNMQQLLRLPHDPRPVKAFSTLVQPGACR